MKESKFGFLAFISGSLILGGIVFIMLIFWLKPGESLLPLYIGMAVSLIANGVALGIIEVIVSAVILVVTFYGKTSLSGQLAFHAIIAVVWLVIGFVVYQMDWAGFGYIFIAILLLLVTAFILCTIYTMTDYIVKSAEKDAYLMIYNLI